MNYVIYYALTNDCNLKCFNCSFGCDYLKPDEIFYVDIKTFKNHINIIKNKMKNASNICLGGGEPTLHPNFLEICKYINDIYPTITISIYTNGINSLFNNNEFLKQLSQLNNFYLLLSIYPFPNSKNFYNTLFNKLKKYNIPYQIAGYRFFFSKMNEHLIEDLPKEFYINCKKNASKNNTIYIYKNNLYSCCMEASIQSINDRFNLKEFNFDINSLENEKQLFTYNYPSQVCTRCPQTRFGGEEIILWRPSETCKYNSKEDKLVSLVDLYLFNYEKYYYLCNDYTNVLQYIPELEEITKYDDSTNLCQGQKLQTKFTTGKIDLYYQITNNTTLQDIDLFKENYNLQNNKEDFNLYIYSINCIDPNLEKYIYIKFMPFSFKGINSYLFKETNEYDGYKSFLNNSYLKNKLIITPDIALTQMKQKDYLISQYNKMREPR